MSDKLIKVKKNIHQTQAGGNKVLIAYEGQLVKESLLLELGYKIEDVAANAPAIKAVKESEVEDKAIKPAATKRALKSKGE